VTTVAASGPNLDLPSTSEWPDDASEGQVMTTGRSEARLRPEFGALYPYLMAGVWESAAVLADRVVAWTLGRPEGRFVSGDCALPRHFEFRGIDPSDRPSRGRTEGH